MLPDRLSHPSVLLVLCGISLLWAATAVPAAQTNTVHEYHALEPRIENGSIVAVDAATGDRLTGLDLEPTLDERVLCFRAILDRPCALERAYWAGNLSIRGDQGTESIPHDEPGRFQYLWLGNETFLELPRHVVSPEDRRPDRVDFSTMAARIAVDAGSLTDAERRVLQNGRAFVTHTLPHDDRIVRYEGEYYVLSSFGSQYQEGGTSACGFSYEGFCQEAELYRTFVTWRVRLLGLLGALALYVGGRPLLREGVARLDD